MSLEKLSCFLFYYAFASFMFTILGSIQEATDPCPFTPNGDKYAVTFYFGITHSFVAAITAGLLAGYHERGFPKRPDRASWHGELFVLMIYLFSSCFPLGVLITTRGRVLLDWSCTFLGCFLVLNLYLFLVLLVASPCLIPYLVRKLRN